MPATLERTVLNLIDGEPSAPSVVLGVAEDPSTGEAIGEIVGSTATEVDRALDAAYKAWGHGEGPFSGLPLTVRLAALERLAGALEEREAEFAHWHAQEVGIPIATARIFAAGLAGVVRGVASAAPEALATRSLASRERRVEVRRLPWGPAALYPSWNAPAFLAVSKLANALAAGCPAILKPSEYAPATAGVLVGALQAADLPRRAVQVVCGDAVVGAQLAADRRVRMISYTGGTSGGRAVATAAVARMAALQLELSASNPAIVARDADVELAAAELARGTTVLNGQWCEAPRRVFVHASRHDALVADVVAALERRTIGPALSETSDLGPLAHRRQLHIVDDAVDRLAQLGDAVRSHPSVPSDGFYISPTVVAGLPLGAVDGEIFGPVLAVSAYRDLDDALEAANALGDGLAGYVFAGDRDRAFAVASRLHAGEVRIGGTRLLDLADGATQSFWGTSGIGGHGGVAVLRAHVGDRIVGEEDRTLAL